MIDGYTIRSITRSQLIEELEESRAEAARYYGDGHFRYRSSEAMDNHNRDVRHLEKNGHLTAQESERLIAR